MAVEQQRKWTLLFRIKDGHKYFADEQGRIGVADYSGYNPDDTEVGPLYLNEESPIFISGNHALVNVWNSFGEGFCVSEPPSEAFFLAEKLGKNIKVASGTYQVVRVE